jgi:preprotein translocase subunit SecG
MGYIFGFLLSGLAIFLILLVLVQRGRGGGLAGALGGMGGSSAFGAKAGDVFTRITIIVVAIWILLCILVGHWARSRPNPLLKSGTSKSQPSSELPLNSPLPPSQSATTLPAAGASGTAIDAGAAKTEVEAPAKATTETKSETPAGDK